MAVVCGHDSVALVDEQGKMWWLGCNIVGSLEQEGHVDFPVPVQFPPTVGRSTIVMLAAASHEVVCLRSDNSLWILGTHENVFERDLQQAPNFPVRMRRGWTVVICTRWS